MFWPGQAYVVTTEEGGKWQRWRPGRFRSVFTVVFENGFTWDCYAGSRKHTKSAEELRLIESNLE